MSIDVYKVTLHIVAELFKGDNKRWQNIINTAHQKNQEIQNIKSDGFWLLDERVIINELAGGIKKIIDLHDSLLPEMMEQRKQLEASKFERVQIHQIITKLIMPCHNWQDVRDALPDTLKDTLDDIKNLPREREEAFTLRDSLSKRQYEKLKPRIEFYSATRLIFG